MVARLCLLLFFVVIFHEAIGLNETRSSNVTLLRSGIATRSLRKRYSVYKQRLSWPQALLFCRRRKKQLATIMDEDEHQAVRNEVNRLTEMWEGANFKKFWIGGGVEGSDWVWGTTGKQLEYVIWSKGQPKQKNFCLQINSKDEFKFVSGKCEELSMFVCQS